MSEDFPTKMRSGYYNTKLDYKADKEAWNTDQGRLHEEFEQDLFAFHGVTENAQRDMAYQLAWERGHSAGIHEIAMYFSDLAELIK